MSAVAFFSSWPGRLIVIGLGLLALLFSFERYKAQLRAEGATQVISDINAKAGEQANDAIKARAAAGKPGALDRLRKGSCRNC